MRDTVIVAFLFVCSACAGAAQDPAKAKEATGGVTGHVLCADTNLPARLASVLLQPAYEAVPVKPKRKPGEEASENDEPRPPMVSIAQTSMDGSYSISGVSPGKYYVIVEKIGYLSPLSQLTREQLNKPDDAAEALIDRLLVPVTVTANHVAQADVTIVRGGMISGTVRFDDGSPNGGGSLSLLQKTKDGKWEQFRKGRLSQMLSRDGADDQGRYRLSGLPAGEYLVEAEIRIQDWKINNVFEEVGAFSFNGGYSLSIYSGGALRTKDAKPLKLQDGEVADLVDIEIPVSKMHAISGSILDASGHTVNAGRVSIVHPDDDTELVSTAVSKEDEQFHFYFVPEGTYTLKVTVAKDVTRTEVPYPPGNPFMPPTHTEEKTVRQYQDEKQPLVVEGDMIGVVATVGAKDVKLTAAQ